MDMDDATQSAHLIRQNLLSLRSRHGFVSAQQKCEICGNETYKSPACYDLTCFSFFFSFFFLGLPTVLRQFYLFPCSHSFHVSCLLRELQLSLDLHTRCVLHHSIRYFLCFFFFLFVFRAVRFPWSRWISFWKPFSRDFFVLSYIALAYRLYSWLLSLHAQN